MSKLQTTAPMFDISANYLCLDFANTLENRAEAVPQELLHGYSDLVAWSVQAQILSKDVGERLKQEADQQPGRAKAILVHAIALREVIYRVFKSIALEKQPNSQDLQTLNVYLATALSRACIVPAGEHYAWSWDVQPETELEQVLWPIVRSAADLLTSDRLSLTRLCAAEDCGWLFLDTSKNRSRRWCNMQSCGNRAKVRRHYVQKKKAEQKA
ncbi:CGNR zinc finger domain-containing protein [Ktedonosporobacter rubrisoli]|nr:ABATE domain-containing protein [Ktedonosporobacter rubrisoli]